LLNPEKARNQMVLSTYMNHYVIIIHISYSFKSKLAS
jgi:hypothetical protein